MTAPAITGGAEGKLQRLQWQAGQWGGVQNGQNLMVLYKENIFLWTMTSNSLTEILPE